MSDRARCLHERDCLCSPIRPQVKRNVELELEAVRALQEQGVPYRHDEGDSNASEEGLEEVGDVGRKLTQSN